MNPGPVARRLARSDREQRKRSGVFYTEPPVAQYMVAATLSSAVRFSTTTPRIVDPACGQGALIWPAYLWLCERFQATTPIARCLLIQRHLFGVDLDRSALERLRQKFREDIVESTVRPKLDEVLQANFRSGNAVSGQGWEQAEFVSDTAELSSDPFHWHEQFPQVSAAGGFDVVIMNPPYRRERGAKSDLRELERSALGRTHRTARMDLWHYFFHRSLDLLRPDGLLTFIVNSYWTTSTAGRPLIRRLQQETTPLEFIQLDDAPVFPDVGGRHLIARVRKRVTIDPCRILRLKDPFHSRVLAPHTWSDLSNHPLNSESFDCRVVSRGELFRNGRLNLDGREPSQAISRHSRADHCLGDLFEVRQGIAENPPRVTARQAELNPHFRAGEGVFVLTTDELARLNLNSLEQAVVRPYYSAGEITKCWEPQLPQQWLLYLTRETAPDLTALRAIERHLSRFRPLLEQRREVRQGKIAWWHLHWPRESRLFEQPRILAVQMVRSPRFAYVEPPTYVGFSVNVIVDRVPPSTEPSHNWSLESLAVVLNSSWAARWFEANAKQRGVNLDITGGTLKQFPLPRIDAKTAEELIRLARTYHQSDATTVQVTNLAVELVTQSLLDHSKTSFIGDP